MKIKTLLLVSSLCFVSSSSFAQTLGLDFTSIGGSSAATTPVTVGFSFNVTSPITVTGLAFLDPDASGGEVGLWNASQNLLGSVTVTSSDPTLGGAGFNYELLSTPVVLSDGRYVVAAEYSDSSESYSYNVSGQTTIPQITYVAPFYSYSPTLTFPLVDDVALNNGFYGADIVVSASAPDGGTTMGLMGMALAGLGIIRRKCGKLA